MPQQAARAGTRWRIGLFAPRAFHFYAHEIVDGMRACKIGTRQRVLPVDLLYQRDEETPALLEDCELDGMILGLDRGHYERYAALLPDVPMVNVHPDHLLPEIPTIAISPRALARATVDYYLSLGIGQVAAVHTSTTEAQSRVNRYLAEFTKEAGGTFQNFEIPGFGVVSGYERRRGAKSQTPARNPRNPRHPHNL